LHNKQDGCTDGSMNKTIYTWTISSYDTVRPDILFRDKYETQ